MSDAERATRDPIVFGTDGWRDVIGFGFHAANVVRVARAYAGYLRDVGAEAVVVGRDTRFNGDRFARLAADVLASAGLHVFLVQGPVPTPVLSFAVRHVGAGGGVMLTASHNPPAYQGFKLKGPYGGTATSEIYRAVAERIDRNAAPSGTVYPPPSGVEPLDIRGAYFDAVSDVVDLDRLGRLEGVVVHDAMGGSAGGWLAGFVEHAGLPLRIEGIRSAPDAAFYGVNPEPIPANLAPTRQRMARGDALFATATDGDGDRLGVVLPDGTYFDSHQIFAVLLDLMTARGATGRVVKTFTVSRVIERLAAVRGAPVVETPVGFKHIVDAFLEGDVMIGGEESGGIGVSGHIPERDGLVNSLLLLEAMERRNAPLAEIFAQLEVDAEWRHAYDRLDLHLGGDGRMEAVVADLRDPPARIAGRRVESVERRDGVKLNLSGGAWLLFRPSGTEPVLRIYCEAASEPEVRDILRAAERFAHGDLA